MTNLDSILKSRDITLSTKIHLVKAMVFPVVMYGCESWTVRKAEHQKNYAFELWCWRRLETTDQELLKMQLGEEEGDRGKGLDHVTLSSQSGQPRWKLLTWWRTRR